MFSGCDLLERSINQGQEVLTKLYSMFAKKKESERVHACTAVATPQQRGEWKHNPRVAVVTDIEDSNSDDEYSWTPPFFYPEDSNDEESLSDPPSAEHTPEPVSPSETPTKELTSEPDYDALSEPSAPTREDSMGNLSPKDIVR